MKIYHIIYLKHVLYFADFKSIFPEKMAAKLQKVGTY